MKTIWKFPLAVGDRVEVMMPARATILTVQAQHGTPCLWAIVDPESKQHQLRIFRIVGTGHPFNLRLRADCEYVGTVQLLEGGLVLHVFELTPEL